MAEVEALQAFFDARHAQAHGLSVAEYVCQVRQRLTDLVADRAVQVHIRSAALISFLREERWKTLFDGVESAGLQDIAKRRSTEAAVIGIPTDAPPEDRPAYGSLVGSDSATLREYGGLVLHLDDEVRLNVGFCLGDSLAATESGTRPSLASAPLLDPNLRARYCEVDVLEATSLAEACHWAHFYAEAHIHGRVKIRDIVTVGYFEELEGELIRLLDEHGLVPIAEPS